MLLTPNLGEIHLHKPRLNKNDTIVTRNQAIRAQIVVRLDWIPLPNQAQTRIQRSI